MHLDVLESADTADKPDVQIYDKFVHGRGTMIDAGQNGIQRYELKCNDSPVGKSVYKIAFHTGYFNNLIDASISYNIAVSVDRGATKSSTATKNDTGTISKVKSLSEVEVTRADNKCTYKVTDPTVTHWNLQ